MGLCVHKIHRQIFFGQIGIRNICSRGIDCNIPNLGGHNDFKERKLGMDKQ